MKNPLFRLGALALATLFCSTSLHSQQQKDYAAIADENVVDFKKLQNAFNANFETKDKKAKAKGWKAFKRWEYFHEKRVDANGQVVNHAAHNFEEYNKFFGHRSAANAKSSASAVAGNWTYIGPPGGISTNGGAGRTIFITFHPGNPTTMYTGSAAGGLWRSTNGGLSWSVMADHMASLGCSDLAIDPTNTNIMYLATGDHDAKDTYSIGVLKSLDGGVTWSTTGLLWTTTQNYTISKLLIDPNNTQTLYAASSAGLYKTTDGGINWFVVKSGSIKDIEFKPFNTNTIYACNGPSFFISKNAGVTWQSVPTNFNGGVGRSVIAVTPADSNYIYMLGGIPGTGSADDYGFAGIVRSTDGGVTFSLRSDSPNIMGWSTSGSDQGGQAWYDIALAVSPTNKDLIFTGGVNIWKSSNGGTTMTNCTNWWGSGNGYSHADQHALEFLPGSGTTVYAANDGGVFRTQNAGTAWTDLSNGLHIAQQYNLGVSQTNSALTLTGWQDNGTNLHNGTLCEEVMGGDGFESVISWANASEMYAEVYYGDIGKSTDGGNSFFGIVGSGGSGVDEDGAWNTPFIQHPTDDQQLLVGKTEVYRTTDGGGSWNQVGSISGNGLLSRLAYAPSNPNYIYATDGGGLWVSTDGNTFTNKSTSVPGNITGFAIDSQDPEVLYVSCSGFSPSTKVFVSKNAGTSWQSYSNGLPNVMCNHIVFEPGSYDALYLATDIGVFYRDSTMANWIAYSDGLPNVVVTELEIQVSSGKLRAATYGRGLWETDLYTAPTNPPVAAFTANLQQACKSKPVNFYDASTNLPSSFNWTFTGGTPSSSTVQFPIISYQNPGVYPVKLVVSNVAGSDSIEYTSYITIHPNPVAFAGNDTTICRGDTIQLNATGGTQYTWNITSGLSNLFISNPKGWPTSFKNYNVTVADSNGCKTIDYVSVYVIQPFATPAISASGNVLTATPAGGSLQYQWYYNNTLISGANTNQINADSAGTYVVVVNDTSGCFTVSSSPYVVLGLNELIADGGWSCYPNPSSGQVFIRNEKGGSDNAFLEVFSVEGRLVHTQNLNTATALINAELSAGIYTLKLSDEKGNFIGKMRLMVVKN